MLQRRLAWYRMLMHWTVTFLGNLAGSLFIVGVLFHYGDTFAADPYKAQAMSFAVKKQVSPSFGAIFLRGIGCNWLVCLACFFAIQGRSLTDKIVGIWWPIFAFVSLGFDHTVANMAFIPLGIILGAPNLTVGLYIWKGIIPVVLGNIVGGGVFCGKLFPFSICYLMLTLCSHVLLVHVHPGLFQAACSVGFRRRDSASQCRRSRGADRRYEHGQEGLNISRNNLVII